MSFFFILSTFLAVQHRSSVLTANERGKVDQQIQQIDQQIQELELMKRGYESKAIRHEDLGDTKQFKQEYNLETRRHYQLAEQNRQIADKIQKDIDLLNSQKEQLLSRTSYSSSTSIAP
jgi:hypothetical protein